MLRSCYTAAVLALLQAWCLGPCWADGNATNERLACGPTALSVAAGILGRNVSTQELKSAFSGRLTGTHRLSELSSAARKLGLETCLVRERFGHTTLAPLPMIVPLRTPRSRSEEYHYVVVYGQSNEQIQVVDYPKPPRLFSAEILDRWSAGTGLYIASNTEQLTSAGLVSTGLLTTQIALAFLAVVVSSLGIRGMVKCLLRRRAR